METIRFAHTYNGKKVGAITQNTSFVLNGALTLDEVISLFQHFVKAVWEVEVKISYKQTNQKACEAEACQTDAVGFDLSSSSTDEDDYQDEDD